MQKRHIFLLALIFPVLLFCSCSLIFGGKETHPGTSSISVRFPASSARRSLPGEISYITVSIEPRVQNAIRITPASGDNEAKFSGLSEGSYRILASAFDAGENEIAHGESDAVDVKTGTEASVVQDGYGGICTAVHG